MSSSVGVRALAVGDRARWHTLWAGYLAFYQQALADEVTEWLWKRLIDPADQPHGLVALADNQIVGFVHYHFHLTTWNVAGCCYLEDLFVVPDARGKGVGRALIQAVYGAAGERGVPRVYWHTQESNTQARRLYDKVAVLTPFVQYRRESE